MHNYNEYIDKIIYENNKTVNDFASSFKEYLDVELKINQQELEYIHTAEEQRKKNLNDDFERLKREEEAVQKRATLKKKRKNLRMRSKIG